MQALRELGCPMGVKDSAGLTAMRYARRAGHGEALRASQHSGCPKATKTSGDGARVEEVDVEQKDEEEEEENGSCIVCLDREAWWVFDKCGHKCICKGCMRKQKEKAAGAAGKKGRKKGSVVCPLCRAETRVVPASGYDGEIFES